MKLVVSYKVVVLNWTIGSGRLGMRTLFLLQEAVEPHYIHYIVANGDADNDT